MTSPIIQTILQNLPLRKPVDKVISSTRSGTELRSFIQKFNPFVDDVRAAIEDLDDRVTDATSTTINLDLQELNLPPGIQSEVHLHVTNLAIGDPDGENNGGIVYERPTEFWDDSVNPVEFFIDTANGSDSNDGLTQSTPFQSLKKAVEVLRTKLVSYNGYTYLRIKGQVSTPLDFSGVYSESVDYNFANLVFLDSWGGENEKWTLNVLENPGYGTLPVFFSRNSDVGLSFSNCNFIISSQAKFEGGASHVDETCILTPLSPYSGNTIVYAGGSHSMDGVTWDMQNATGGHSILATGNNTTLRLSGTHNFINGDYNNIRYCHAFAGAIVDASALVAGGLKKSLSCDELSTLRINHDGNLTVSSGSAGNLSSNLNDEKRIFSTLFFPTLVNGRYFLAYAPFKGRLIEFKIVGRTGSGTFRLDINGSELSESVSANFNNYQAIAEQSVGFNCPWTNSYSFYLNVSNASGLADVTVQMLWEPNAIDNR